MNTLPVEDIDDDPVWRDTDPLDPSPTDDVPNDAEDTPMANKELADPNPETTSTDPPVDPLPAVIDTDPPR